MAMDMDVHTLKSEGIEEFAQRPEAASLLLTGLCEIHSNAQMFGGMESTGFKDQMEAHQQSRQAHP